MILQNDDKKSKFQSYLSMLDEVDYNDVSLDDCKKHILFFKENLNLITEKDFFSFSEKNEILSSSFYVLDKINERLILLEKQSIDNDEKININDAINDALFISIKLNKFFISVVITSDVDELKKYKKEFEKTKIELKDDIDGMQNNFTNHSLTFMSIFAAIITIITTVVNTTSTWLNNAKNISFIIAIIIPAVIITFVILTLLLLMKCLFLRQSNSNGETKPVEKIKEISNGKENKKSDNIFSKEIIGIIITLFILLVIGVGIASVEDKIIDVEHEYIIIADYKIDHENDKITYVYNGVEFTIECNYDLIHEDGLHYCTEHNKFE